MNDFNIKTEEYTLVTNEAQFLIHYPKPERGKYRPQPYEVPDKYPCLMKWISQVNNDYGTDVVFINFEYDFQEVGDE